MTRGDRRPDARAVARLRRWYAWSIDGHWSVPDVIGAWTLRVPPNIWNLGWPPTESEIAGYPGRYLIHTDGSAWGPHDLALTRAALAARLAVIGGLAPVEIGAGAFYFGGHIGELVRCSWAFAAYRASERHQLAPHAADSAATVLARLAAVMGIETMRPSVHVGRRKDLSPRTGDRHRKGGGTARLARALLIWGLIEAGLHQRAAIRLWLGWEIALDGPLAHSAVVRNAANLAASGADRHALREFEENIRGATKQTWAELGISR